MHTESPQPLRLCLGSAIKAGSRFHPLVRPPLGPGSLGSASSVFDHWHLRSSCRGERPLMWEEHGGGRSRALGRGSATAM